MKTTSLDRYLDPMSICMAYKVLKLMIRLSTAYKYKSIMLPRVEKKRRKSVELRVTALRVSDVTGYEYLHH